MPEVQPYDTPYPNAVVGWTGLVWHCLSVDAEGRLQVRGEDQLFSFLGVLAVLTTGNPSGINGFINSPAVPEGEIWEVTNIVVQDPDTPLTEVWFALRPADAVYHIGIEVAAIPAGRRVRWSGHVWLDHEDFVRAYLTGCRAADNCTIWVTGYRMTVEV